MNLIPLEKWRIKQYFDIIIFEEEEGGIFI